VIRSIAHDRAIGQPHVRNEPGVPLDLVPADRGSLVEWQIWPTGDEGYVHLVNVASGLCLDLEGNRLDGRILQHPCTPRTNDASHRDNQLWRPLTSAGETLFVPYSYPRYFLAANPNRELELVSTSGIPDVRWQLVTVDDAKPPELFAIDSVASGVAIAARDECSGTAVATGEPHTGLAQEWEIWPTQLPGDVVQLVSARSGLCMEVASGGPASEARIIEEPCKSERGRWQNQLWTLPRNRVEPTPIVAYGRGDGVLRDVLDTDGTGRLFLGPHGGSSSEWFFERIR
jgi:Ricin-type beta-trefoil lectin domain-like